MAARERDRDVELLLPVANIRETKPLAPRTSTSSGGCSAPSYVRQRDESSSAFKEVANVRHPHIVEYTLDSSLQELFFRRLWKKKNSATSIHQPTHLYLGDVLLMNLKGVMWPNLSVREGIGMIFLFANNANGIFFP
ncbi:unnamed protein product [Fraxinus pennsylvanica]|uniref:Uncharacterized protein n=1 Tax=Fraxinus pennsylvanica TaxID=56036 RepID=A0AAD1Z9A5_9LAMI|nr:unnamed protein product [Fraxinus pennsylvanica]